MIGEEIRNYRILKELGKGGMGVVYKANQISLGRMVAMKVLPHHLTSDPAFIKRFENEARAIAKLNHPNIVQIYDIGHHEQIHYYTMEFIEGPSLDEIIYKEGFLPLDRAISIIAQVAKALQYAHGHGIVHRDIKPSNIMIDKSGRVKVTDFGLALQERTTRLTMDGSIVGTPEYMSPEQAAGQTATARSDIYSLGVVFYEILTGKVPFEAESALMVLDKIRTSEPQWPRSLNPDIPVEVEEAIRNMMAKNPRDRYASCQELIQDVRRLKSGEAVPTKTRRPIPFHLPAGRGVLLLIPALILAAILSYLWYRGWPLKEWKQMNERVALLEEQWDSVRQQCEVADMPLLEDQADQMDQELASFKEELKDIQQQYEGSDAMGRGKLRQKALRRLREMEPKVHESEEWLGGVQEQCKDETRRIIGMLESLEIQWKNVRQQCDVAFGVLPLEDQVDQTDQELASFKEELKDIQQQYDGGDATALDRLREMESRVARSQERLEGIRERCEDTPGLILRGLELLGGQLMRVRQHCEGGDATALKHEFDELKTKIALLEVLSRDIRQQHRLGLIPVSRNQLETAGRGGIDLLEKQLGDIEQEHRWVDVLVLKNGSRIRCEIIGESVEKVRFRTPQGRAEVSRNEINFVVYSTDIEKGIAKILEAEVPQTRHRISELEKKISAPDEEREPAAAEEPESPPEGEPEKGPPREGPREEPSSVYRASIAIPLLEEKWRITNDCAEGAGVSFDDETISIFTSHRIGRSACTTTISTTDPVQGDPHSIEMLAQVRRIKAPIDDRAIFSLVVTFSDGKSIEYSIFDSQSDQNSAEVLRTAEGLRIDRPELRILANKSWHVPVLPLSKDAAKIGGSKEIASIALVHRHEGPTACKFVLVCKAIIVNTM